MTNPLKTTTLTIKRIDTSAAVNVLGELEDTDSKYTTANRGSLTTSVSGRATIMRIEEQIAYGVETNKTAWIFRSKTDMKCDTRDLVEFTDSDGATHKVRVVVKTHKKSPASTVYRTIGVEDDARA